MAPALDPRAASLPTEGSPRRYDALALGLLLLVAAGLVVNLGVVPLAGEEARRGVVALEMSVRGNLIVPTTNGNAYLNKPPGFNWVLLACMRLFGSTGTWVLRVPTVASMLLWGLLSWRVVRRHLGPAAALTATGFLLTFPTLLFYGSLYGEGDVFYSLLVTLHALAIFTFGQRGQPLAMFAASYALAAVGFLTKAMPSLAVQALTLPVWLVVIRRWRWLFSWQHLVGLGVFGLCVGGYFLAYSAYEPPGAYLAKLLYDSTERTAAVEKHGLGELALQLLQFPLQLLWLGAPWVLFLPGLLGRAGRERIRSTPFLRFCVVFVAANVAPYWISPGNRPRYMFMFLPFLAALLAAGAEELDRTHWYPRALRWLFGALLGLVAAGAAAFPLTPWRGLATPLWPWLVVAVALAALAVQFWRPRPLRSWIWLACLALAVARVGYDLVIPVVRRAQSPNLFYMEVATALNREHRQEPVYLLGEVTRREYGIPGTGLVYTIPSREWFSYTLTYHYTDERRELLRYADVPRPGALHLAYARFGIDEPHEVLRVFECPRGRDEDLKLVRLRR